MKLFIIIYFLFFYSNLFSDDIDNFFSSYNRSNKKRIIMLDAGHGGKDPGAIGNKGTYEKNIVLSISKKLRSLILKKRNLSCIMTRNNDNFISLFQRQNMAKIYKPDIFISIHADSHIKKNVKGATVFVLSKTAGNDSISKYLSKQYYSKNKKSVDFILSDLKFDTSISKSEKVAKNILYQMSKKLHILDRGIKRAPFAVLKNFSIPSILIEVGFISNRTDEKLLNSSYYQKKIAECIFEGIKSYLSNF